MSSTFPATPQDYSAKSILDKYNKVVKRDNYPKMTPYEDKYGEHKSPLTDFMYYNKLPEVYRTFDKPLGNPLYRYLQSLIESGYSDLIYNNTKGFRGIENLTDLVDPQTCPDEFLPYYFSSMGIDWFPDLITKERGTYYLRTFLSNVGEIYKRRGTESVVKYIAKVLTEMDVKLRYQRLYDSEKETLARILWVELQAHTQEEIDAVELNAKVIKRFIDTQIPYYITSIVTYVLEYSAEIEYFTGVVSAKRVCTKVIPTTQEVPNPPSDFIYIIENDEVTIIRYIGENSTCIVPKTIEDLPVTKISAVAFNYRRDVDTVKFLSGVTTIE